MLFKKMVLPFLAVTVTAALFYNYLVNWDCNPVYKNISSKDSAYQQDVALNADTQPENTEMPNPPEKGCYIYINLDTFTMYLYKNAELLKTYPVSGGKSSTPTPLPFDIIGTTISEFEAESHAMWPSKL
jgi:hypothetical protein